MCIDVVLRLLRRPLALIQVQIAQDPAKTAQLIVTVENLKCLGELCLAPVGPQQAMG
jgi:hypothetical protein